MIYPHKVGIQTLTDQKLKYYDPFKEHEFLIAALEHPWGSRLPGSPLSAYVNILGSVDVTEGKQYANEILLSWDPTPEKADMEG